MSSTSNEEGLAHKHQLSGDSVPQNEGGVKRGEIGKDFNVKADEKSGDLEISLITKRLGAEGRAKYASAYENELNSGFNNTEAEFLRSYSRYYLLGLNGKKITDIPSKYADRISQSARKAAYKAGVADRNSSLDAKYKASNEAVVKDGGLIRNHNTEKLSDDVNNTMDRVSKIFGVTVTVKDKVYNKNGKEVNGKYSNGEIELSYDKIKNDTHEQMAARIFRHEITHRIQELAPKQYDKFRKLAYDYAEKHINNGSVSLSEKYADNRNLNLNDAIDEVVADLMGIDEFALEIARKDLTLAQKIKGIIKDLLDVTGLRKYSEAERIERAWEKACNQAQKQVEINRKNPKLQKNNGVVKYSYGVEQKDIDDYVDAAYEKRNEKGFIKYAKPSERLKNDLKSEVSIEEYSHALRDNDIRHIKISHGEETNEKYPITKDDIKQIPYIVENYDKVFYKTNAKGQGGIVYVKVTPDNTVYYVESITTEYNKEKLLVNKQMVKVGLNDIPNLYGLIDAINKKQSSSQYLADLEKIRKAYVQDVKENYYSNNISQNNTKSQEKNSEGDVLELLAENERLRNRNDILEKRALHFKNQWYRSKPFTPRAEDIAKLARKLGKGYKGN